MRFFKSIFIFLPILCSACATGTDKIAEYNWGKYNVKVLKQYQPGYFGGWTTDWFRRHEVRYGFRSLLGNEWIDKDLNLALQTEFAHSKFIYLEKTKKLVQYFYGEGGRQFLIASIDTGRDDLNITPIVGLARFANGEKTSRSPAIFEGAKINHSQIFWGMPDEEGNSGNDRSRNSSNDQFSEMKYFYPWMASFNNQIIIDHQLGVVYPENIYIERYRHNKSLIPIYRAWEKPEQVHPASEEIKALSKPQIAKDINFNKFVWLGITEDREAVWYADFSENRAYAQVCLENLKNDSWQCVVLATPNFPQNLIVDLKEEKVSTYSVTGDVPFNVPGFSISYGVVTRASNAEMEIGLRDWLRPLVKPVKNATSWRLEISPNARVLDNAIVNRSK